MDKDNRRSRWERKSNYRKKNKKHSERKIDKNKESYSSKYDRNRDAYQLTEK